MRPLLLFPAVIAVLLLPPTLHAVPITGQFSITGSSVTDNGSALTFNPTSIAVGASNTLSGSFVTLLSPGETGEISPSINYSSYTPGSASFSLGSGGSPTVVFTIDTVMYLAVGALHGFSGTGTIDTSATGYDSTPGTLAFSTQADGTVTFSATATATGASVAPEPGSLLMLGTGALGAFSVMRRRTG